MLQKKGKGGNQGNNGEVEGVTKGGGGGHFSHILLQIFGWFVGHSHEVGHKVELMLSFSSTLTHS